MPIFWLIGSPANPNLRATSQSAPIIVAGPDCTFDPFANVQATVCGRVLGELTGKGLAYEVVKSEQLRITVGETVVTEPEDGGLTQALDQHYDLTPQTPPMSNLLVLLRGVIGLSFLSGMTYGPVAALLSDMFPPAVRYSSLSIPYHIGTGYFGGFLPFIASYIVARTGDPYAGLWYTLAVVAFALLVIAWGEGKSWRNDLDEASPAR